MKLDGIAIAGFRSFGDQLEKINDLQKINIFIGKNNSGKSNILRFIEHVSRIKFQEPYKGFDQVLDYSVDSKSRDIKFGFQIKNLPRQQANYTKELVVFFHNGMFIFLNGLKAFGLFIRQDI